MRRIIKRLLFNYYLLRKTNWLKLWKFHQKDSENIVLLIPAFPNQSFYYFFSAAFENDFALINALLERNKTFKIIIGGKNLYALKDKKIYHNLSQLYTFHKGTNYADSLLNYQEQLELNNNILIPRSSDTRYWENKVYMQNQFKKLNISHPTTYVVDKEHKAPKAEKLSFPVLFKPAHSSGSIGIVKINNKAEYQEVLEKNTFIEFLIQEWIDMRIDLRLIYIGDELVLHYWRKNMAEDWKPTSTGHGSQVDFEMLPEQWMDFLFKEYKKLNLKTGAFDVTWHQDDLTTIPKILEVSPSYMPNPRPVGKYLNKPYGEFKKAIWGTDVYYKKYIDLVFELKIKFIDAYDRC